MPEYTHEINYRLYVINHIRLKISFSPKISTFPAQLPHNFIHHSNSKQKSIFMAWQINHKTHYNTFIHGELIIHKSFKNQIVSLNKVMIKPKKGASLIGTHITASEIFPRFQIQLKKTLAATLLFKLSANCSRCNTNNNLPHMNTNPDSAQNLHQTS